MCKPWHAEDEVMYEIWNNDELLWACDSYSDAYGAAADTRSVLWHVDRDRNVCHPLPTSG